MLRYELSLCIGREKTNRGVTIKCHDDGISLAITFLVCRQTSKWRVTEEAFIIPTGATAVLKIEKPDKTKCLIDGKLEASAFVFELSEQAFTAAGTAEAEVSIYGANGGRVTSANFPITIPEECVCSCKTESKDYVDIVGDLIKAAKDAEASAKKAAEDATRAQVNGPKIGENGNWFVFDVEVGKYTDTGVSSAGNPPSDEQVEDAVQAYMDENPISDKIVETVNEYMVENPVDSKVDEAVNDYLEGNPSKVNDAVSDYLEDNPIEVPSAYVAPRAIEPYQTDFIENYNRYDRTKNTEKTVISAAGAETTSSSFQTSDYIHMPAGSYWVTNSSTSRFEYYAVYGLDKMFVSRLAMPAAGTNVIEVETECFVRFMGYNTKVDGKNIMVVRGEEAPSGYVPHGVRFTGHFAISGENIDDKTVRKEKTDFIQTSANLINHMTITKGYVVNTSGAIVSNSQYGVTEKIYTKPSTTYVCNNVLRLALYKADGTVISVQGKSDPATSFAFTTTASTVYVVAAVQVKSANLSNWQMNEGETLLEYEKQHLVINGYRLYDEIVAEVDPIDTFKTWDKVIYDKASPFTLTAEAEAVAGGERTASAVIAKYDALLAGNPLYIKKTELGADSVGNMLYRYDFNEPEQPHSSGAMYSTAKPKVILIGGVHPEWGGIYSLYNTMKQITDNEALIELRRNTHFIVVPVVNVYGCSNASRKNANGIDLARNFEVGFTVGSDPSATTYGGTAALSELEAQYVDTILQENKDAIIFLSCHSFQRNNTDYDCIWGACGTRYMNNLCKKVIDKLSRVWRNSYDFVPDAENVYLGSSEVSAPGGSEGQQGAKYGIQAATLEVGDYFRYHSADALTSFVVSRGTETYINFIMTALQNFNSTDKKLL